MQRYTQFTLHFNNRIARSCGSFPLSLSLLQPFSLFKDLSLPVSGWKIILKAFVWIWGLGEKLKSEHIVRGIIFMLHPYVLMS